MRILFDAYGGDNTPDEAIKAARLAKDQYPIELTLVGDSAAIAHRAGQLGVSLDGIDLHHAPTAITMEDEPTDVLKRLSDCSMAEGLRLLHQGEGDAFVSGGNTGALVVGATMIVKRIKGVKRAALTALIPSATGNYLLWDVGANADCRPEMLAQFAVMGSAYMEKIVGVKEPRVGIANIGTEEHKGTDLQRQALTLLKDAPINFIGNAEVRDVPLGCADVVVCDGFTGNVMLKLTEGLAKMFVGELKQVLFKNLLTKMGALTLSGSLKSFKQKLDYKKSGGAPLLGLTRPVIKAHGSSDAEAFQNAIRQAVSMVENRVVETTEQAMTQLNSQLKQRAGAQEQ